MIMRRISDSDLVLEHAPVCKEENENIKTIQTCAIKGKIEISRKTTVTFVLFSRYMVRHKSQLVGVHFLQTSHET